MKEFKQATLLSRLKRLDEKDIYKDSINSTVGTDRYFSDDFILFRQFTNATKSKYDNVVAVLRHNN
jgi:hypothetical protein